MKQKLLQAMMREHLQENQARRDCGDLNCLLCADGDYNRMVAKSFMLPEYKFRFSGWTTLTKENHMSFVGTFFHKVGAIAKKLFGSTTWEKTAQSVITYTAPLLETVVQLAAGDAAEQTVAKVVNTVQADLATLAAVVDGAHQGDAHGAAVAISALGSIKVNMVGLLQATDVKNSTKATEITAVVNLIVGEVDAMLLSLPMAAQGGTGGAV